MLLFLLLLFFVFVLLYGSDIMKDVYLYKIHTVIDQELSKEQLASLKNMWIFSFYTDIMKKKDLIELKLDDFHKYAVDQKFPLVDKYSDLRKKYTIVQMVALVERFLIPAHESNCLKR